MNITDTRHDCDDADTTVEQIVARIRWLDAALMDLQRELAAAASRDDPGSLAIFRTHSPSSPADLGPTGAEVSGKSDNGGVHEQQHAGHSSAGFACAANAPT